MRMLPCRYAMMQMSAWVCNDVNVRLGICNDVNVRLGICNGVNALLWVCNEVNARLGMQWHECPFGYAMNANVPLRVCHDTECFGANTIYSKISFFQNEASTTPETKIFSNSIYYS